MIYTSVFERLHDVIIQAVSVVGTLVFGSLSIFSLIWGTKVFKKAVKTSSYHRATKEEYESGEADEYEDDEIYRKRLH